MDALSEVILRFDDGGELGVSSEGTLWRRDGRGGYVAFNLRRPNPSGWPQPPLEAAILALRGERAKVAEIFSHIYPADADISHGMCHGGYEIQGLAIDRPYQGDPNRPDFISVEGGGRPLLLSRQAGALLADTLAAGTAAVLREIEAVIGLHGSLLA